MHDLLNDMFFSNFLHNSSLSVFALHPLYLRVQVLSENISEEIKVHSI